MKRSRINDAIRNAEAMLAHHGWALPDFARWSPQDHARHAARSRWLSDRQIGWDVTDFGSGDFDARGLVLLCTRNGIFGAPGERPYAEKLLFLKEGQYSPNHFHWHKMEDIINRGGGTLLIRVYNSLPDEEIDSILKRWGQYGLRERKPHAPSPAAAG